MMLTQKRLKRTHLSGFSAMRMAGLSQMLNEWRDYMTDAKYLMSQ